jgi:beta-galactosidase
MIAPSFPLFRICFFAVVAFMAAEIFAFAQMPSDTSEARQVLSFDRNWKFHLGRAVGADQPAFDDTSWRLLDIPHDWSIEGPKGSDPSAMDGPFDKKSPAGAAGGYLDGGVGWYRKTFVLPTLMQGQHLILLFDGAYADSQVWLNGQLLGHRPYGFSSFYYDLTPSARFEPDANVVAVRLDVQQPCCRWYSGAGLTRHVWLMVTQPVHIAPWGTTITTPEISDAGATVRIRTHVVNDGAMASLVTIHTTILGPDGRSVGEISTNADSVILPGASSDFEQTVQVAQPHRWSPDDPALYHAVTEVCVKHAAANIRREVLDSTSTVFGIRTIEFTKDQGLLLNGKRLEIQGICDHHNDLGCLGSVALRRGYERQLQILKTMGCNAIRTSHNPPPPELLDLCDEMGFLVLDEAFDEWKTNKLPFGYGRFFDQWSEPDLVAMLDRDRNHPSVILWSIGNEIPDQISPNGAQMAKRLVDICHREDSTRLVTSACNYVEDDMTNGFAAALDVFGINYNTGMYGSLKGQYLLVGTETASACSSRGEYGISLDPAGAVNVTSLPVNHQVSSYDVYHPSWASLAQTDLLAVKNAPWVAGGFVWTGFDYLGEPTPYKWPSRSSYFGINDMCGFPKNRYYLYKSQWTSEPLVHLLPHWTWPGFEGKKIPVWVFTNTDTVELFLNGQSLGEKTFATDAIQLHLQWDVPYASGVLKAVAKRNGRVVATDEVHTAGAPARIALVPDRTQIAADGQDLSYLKISVLDQDGNVCPNAENEIHFAVNGTAAVLAGLDNGDPTNHEPFQGTQHRAFHGLALAVLKAGYDATGPVTITASADGLIPATATVTIGGS